MYICVYIYIKAPGLHGCYNDCVKEEDKRYKMQRLSHNQLYCTHGKDNRKDTSKKGLKRKLRMCLEKISLDLEEEEELGMQ